MEQDYLKLVKIMITLTFLTGLLIGLAIGTGDILKSFTYSNSGELKRIDKLKVVELAEELKTALFQEAVAVAKIGKMQFI